MLKLRSEIPTQDKWNVEALYANTESWEDAYLALNPGNKRPRWPKLATFKGRLGESANTLKTALDFHLNLSRELEKLLSYAHLRHDEDVANDAHKSANNKIIALFHDYTQESAWLEPEILSLTERTLSQYLAAPMLASYQFYLKKIIHVKKHTLSPGQEELLALSARSLETAQRAFSVFNNADIDLGYVKDGHGKDRELSHGLYHLYIRDQDRELRKNAFKGLHGKYDAFQNTLCELITGQVQEHLFVMRARNYSSCLTASLYPKNIATTVYSSLILAVRANLGVLHEYLRLRKKMLGLETLHLYDLYIPLTSEVDLKYTYAEAESLVIDSVAPLGSDYQNLLRTGLKEERWIDRYENKNKRSGAYSSGCYDSMPYILLNFEGMLNDVFTLAHEAGHSMHSLLSKRHQPYHYANYPIFVAEVASTFNEELLMRLMLERATKKEEKIYFLNQQIESIRTTLFRQAMFAEFELTLHELAEQDVPLTPTTLKTKYLELYQDYFGSEVVIDPEIDIEWARIPHFYYNFYVYQYATGLSAAIALANRVVSGGDVERKEYLNFLKGGCSRYPLDLLKTAGVDMASPEPVNSAMLKFKTLVDQLKAYVSG